jgi:hypothetical protein
MTEVAKTPATAAQAAPALGWTVVAGASVAARFDGPAFGQPVNWFPPADQFAADDTIRADPDAGNSPPEIACFAAGTRILAETGEVEVEHLAVGDTVITVRKKGPRTRRVIWTGKRSIDIARHPRPDDVRPIRIFAGAFAPGVPERDLLVSPRHAIYVGGHLFKAHALVNGATVIQERLTRFVTYHHVELDEHDIMMAEGLPAESYFDTGRRHAFEGEGSLLLHPDFKTQDYVTLCAPLIQTGDRLLKLRQHLLTRALALGFTATDDLDLLTRTGWDVSE